MRPLLWKEWREQRWKLAFASLMLATFALVGLRARVIADEVLLRYLSGIAVLLLPVLSSTGLVAAERDDGTLESLLALPVRPRLILAAKTLMGLVLCVGPILAALAVSAAVAGGREMSAGAMAGLYARTAAATLSLFFWMFALGVRLPTKTRAALVAVGVLVIWLIASLGIAGGMPGYLDRRPALWVVSPFYFLIAPAGPGLSLVLAAGLHGVVSLALWLWADRQFGKPREGRS